MMKRFAFLTLLATQLGATDCGNVLADPGFDVWCGDSLCRWKVEKGAVERAPTWHDKDSGVGLVGADVAIEQLAPVNDFDGTCITFDMIADIEGTAQLELNIDVEGDGSIERTETIPSAHWAPLHYAIAIAAPFDGVRFEIAKQGDGKVVVAQIEAKVDHDACAGLPPIVVAPRPIGAKCMANADCASNLCEADLFGLCAGCDVTAANACGDGLVCGVVSPEAPILWPAPHGCVDAAAKALGEACIVGAECASNLCAAQRCSACDPTAATTTCADGVACGPAYPAGTGPNVCGAGTGAIATGGACGEDADCASGTCNGAVREECDDGRPCATADDCPAESGLTPGHCTTVGIQGGSCQ